MAQIRLVEDAVLKTDWAARLRGFKSLLRRLSRVGREVMQRSRTPTSALGQERGGTSTRR